MPATAELDEIKALIGAGRLDDAAEHCRRLAASGQDFSHNEEAELIYLLAIITGETGAFQESLPLYDQARRLMPARADVAYNHGVMLAKCGKLADARRAWQDCLKRDLRHRDALFNLGRVNRDLDNPAEAASLFEQMLAIHPGDAEAAYELGLARFTLRDWPAASTAFERTVEAQPDHLNARINLGLTAQRLGRPEAALAHYDAALAAAPNNLHVHVNRAQVLLALGRLAEGFAENEWRRHLLDLRFDAGGRPPWTGEPLDGKTILLFAEQGVGDAIQFLRYAPAVAARGGRVAVYCHDHLASIARRAAGVDTVVGFADAAPAFDTYAPLMSLPHLLGATGLGDIPGDAYIDRPEPVDLGCLSDAKAVGLVWSGNPEHNDDAARSCRLEQLAPLASISGVQLFSLQVAAGCEQLGAAGDLDIVDLAAGFDDFLDTARALAALDLLISVDTATAHLAGALGVRTWLLLPYANDWRWFDGADRTPWYESVRLFRQDENRDWAAVIERVAAELGGSAEYTKQ